MTTSVCLFTEGPSGVLHPFCGRGAVGTMWTVTGQRTIDRRDCQPPHVIPLLVLTSVAFQFHSMLVCIASHFNQDTGQGVAEGHKAIPFASRVRSDLILSAGHRNLHFTRHIGGSTVFPHNTNQGVDHFRPRLCIWQGSTFTLRTKSRIPFVAHSQI